MTEQALFSLDGYTDVPAGRIASAVTFLEMHAPPPVRPVPAKMELALASLKGSQAERYRDIFRRIGERWMWFARLELTPEALADFLANPSVAAFAVTEHGNDVGLLEIDFRVPGEAEIVYFGLVESRVGRGIGRWLMNEALGIAWAPGVSRVWLHTCHFDHPGAIAFYRRSGFLPYKQAIEIVPDPRLRGVLAPGSIPDLPAPR